MSDPPPRERRPRSRGNAPSTEQIKRIATAFDTYASQNETAKTKETKHNRKIRRWTRAATIGAIAYTVVTTIILIFTIRGIQETRRATHQASRAADAATRQANISADTAQRQLRAYIGPVNDSFHMYGADSPPCFAAGEPNCIVFKIKNYGLTPALRPSHCLGFAYGATANIRAAQDKVFSACGNKLAANTFPQEEATLVTQELPNPTDPANGANLLSDLEKKIMIMYLVNRTIYYDVFGDIHHTYICRQIMPARGDQIKGITFARCNAADAYQDD